MERSQIERDGPGALTFGETLTVESIAKYGIEGSPVVTLSVFGSYVEVEFVQHKKTDDFEGGLKPNIPGLRCDRDLSDEQEEYVKAVASLVAGMFHGWFPEQVEEHQITELVNE